MASPPTTSPRSIAKLAEPGLTLVTEPRDRKKAPQTPHEGRFSLFFGVASALIYGDVGLELSCRDRLGDQRNP